MKCPRDGAEMLSQSYWKHPRHVCKACSGQLLSEREIVEALGHPESSTLSAWANVRLAQLPDSKLPCPRDGKAMKLICHEDIEIDICPACRSLWLDHGEYDKIKALRKGRSDLNIDVDPAAVADGVDFNVLDFVGDAVGSVFDGLF